MKTLTFKTNISKADGVAAITPLLNAIEPLDGFALDMNQPDHLLTVQTVDNRVSDEVIRAIGKAGYRAELTED